MLEEAVYGPVHLVGDFEVSLEVPVGSAGLRRDYEAALEVVQRPLFQQLAGKFHLAQVVVVIHRLTV